MDWAMLVKDATSMVRYSSLVPEKATHVVRGLNQVATVQPAQGVPAVAPVQTTAPPPVRRSPRAPSAYAAPVFASSERHCELCALVGRENADSHTLAFCYANPKNAEHKAWRVRARYRDIKRANIEMPDCMKEYAAE
jgi:hypothetical protein